MNDYLTIKQTAEKWGLQIRRVQRMYSEGLIEGAFKFAGSWAIPANAEKPADRRITTGQYRNWRKKAVI